MTKPKFMSLSDRKNQPQNSTSGAAQIANDVFHERASLVSALARPESRVSIALCAAPAAMTRTAARRSASSGAAKNDTAQRSA